MKERVLFVTTLSVAMLMSVVLGGIFIEPVVSSGVSHQGYPTPETRYILHSPIYISGDADFATQAATEGWPGNGTEENPYIIEGYEITGTGDGIYIESTTVWFIIRNCYVHASGNGIYLYALGNGIVENCTVVSGFNEGITVSGSSNVRVINCTASNAVYFGIYSYSSNNVEIINCTAYQNNYYGIMVESSQDVTVLNCTTHDNTYVGIYLKYSTYCTVRNNTMKGESIFVYGSVDQCTLHVIDNNTVNDKKVYYYHDLNTSVLNVPSDAGEVILANVTSPTSPLLISDLNLSYGSCGVMALHSSKIEVRNCSIWGSKVYGIYSYYSGDIFINSTTLVKNRLGAFIAYTDNLTMRSSAVIRSTLDGVKLRYTTNSLITDNVFGRSGGYGLYLYIGTSGVKVYNNTFYYNNGAKYYFSAAAVQGCDDGTGNVWNCTVNGVNYGNYWYDWSRNNDTNDLDGDGVVDYPYSLDGSGADYAPVKKARYAYANITIKSDSDFVSYGFPGIGESFEPYVIEHYGIDGGSAPASISVKNTTAHFEMVDCTLNTTKPVSPPGMAVTFSNVTNGDVVRTTINITDNKSIGIWLSQTTGVNINNCTIGGNGTGIYAYNVTGLKVADCNMTDFNDTAMYIRESRVIIVYNVTVNRSGQNGISITFSNSVVIRDCDLLYGGGYGVRIDNSRNITLMYNVFRNNTKYAVCIEISDYISVYQNWFYYNNGATSVYNASHVQAYDNGTNNKWNTTDGIGNYWSDWTSPDADNNGIVDNPYLIDGSAGARDYYPIADPGQVIPELSFYFAVLFLLACALLLRWRCI